MAQSNLISSCAAKKRVELLSAVVSSVIFMFRDLRAGLVLIRCSLKVQLSLNGTTVNFAPRICQNLGLSVLEIPLTA